MNAINQLIIEGSITNIIGKFANLKHTRKNASYEFELFFENPAYLNRIKVGDNVRIVGRLNSAYDGRTIICPDYVEIK